MDVSVAEGLRQAEQLFRANRLEEMEQLCGTILKAAPTAAEAHRFLGLLAYTRGRLEEATKQARQALSLNPDNAATHDNLSLFLAGLGRYQEAEKEARQALALEPEMANAAHNLGLALQGQGRFADAEPPLRHSLALEPYNAEVWNNLAITLEKLKRVPEAMVCLERALHLRPGFPPAKSNLERLRSLPLPNAVISGTANNRGVEFFAKGLRDQAEVAFRKALALSPELPEPAFNLGKVLLLKKQYPEAEKLLQQALAKRPNWAEVHYHVGFLYFCQRRLTEAECAYRRCLELEPRHVEALNNLGASVLNNQGRTLEARAVYQQALAVDPGNAACHSNMLLNEHYIPGVTLEVLAKAHAEWEAQHAAPLRSTWRTFTQSREPDRPLRVCFISGDFFLHPVGLFLEPLLQRMDRKQWFTICYANQEQNDELTHKLEGLVGRWRWVHEWNPKKLAKQIRTDSIDLLIDMSGHTGRNCLLAVARRPAPVQLTWAGYVGTTGLSAMDYLIADRFHVPVGWEKYYREKVLRLPDGYVCYQPPLYAPDVGPLPALANGYVTFGSLNNTAKINPRVTALWSEILRQVPRSRLILKYHWLDDAGLRQRLTELFAAEGITPDRLELQGTTMHSVQLQQYNRIDLALDPFPYSGGLTTLEACWMGVPVLTCPGETFASRHSLSHLSNIGLTETIAQDEADFVAKAIRLTADLPRLEKLRSGLRQRMAQSPLCDQDRFVGQFTSALRGVWRDWCATGGA